MYNKSPRMGELRMAATPANVGPSTYFLDDCKFQRENCAPFLSWKDRGFSIGYPNYTDASYDLSSTPHRHVKGGVIGKAKRFQKKDADVFPGPGKYYTAIDPTKCKRMDPTPIPGKGKLYVCRVPYTVFGKGPPSIPTKLDENGYDVKCGMPFKNPPNEHDQTLGPAFYKVRSKEWLTTRLYKGCYWSCRTSKRSTFKPNGNPSPADYCINLDCCKSSERDEYVRAMARLFSYVPRYMEAEEMRLMSDQTPGPASYNTNTSTIRDRKSMSIRPVPFVSGAKRFKDTLSDTPGPGHYCTCTCYMNRKDFSHKCTPFNVDACRFKRKQEEKSPGPAYYTVPSPLQEKLCHKMNLYSVVEVPFNHTAERKMSFVNDDQYCMPGPANYPEEMRGKPTLPISGPTFRCGVNRFPQQVSETAEPASYSINDSFNKNRDRTSHNTGKAPFLASASRPPVFGRIKDTPSPSDYSNQGDLADKGLYFSTDFPRFPCSKEDVPGPGTYILHPVLRDSCWKARATHNVKLRENVETRLKTKCKPKDYCKNLNKKKALRWFVQPSADYKHCIFVM